ncbi:hypothetical protein ACSBR2_030997 [Camellia fascicularis]
MVFTRSLFMTMLIFIVFMLFTLTSLPFANAMRPLNEGKWVDSQVSVLLQSILRGTVPPTGPNPCTYIPGQGKGTCP